MLQVDLLREGVITVMAIRKNTIVGTPAPKTPKTGYTPFQPPPGAKPPGAKPTRPTKRGTGHGLGRI